MARKAAKPAGASERPSWWRRWKRRFAVAFLGLLVLVVGVSLTGYAMLYPRLAWAKNEIAKLDELSIGEKAEPTIIVSADGRILYRSITRFQTPVKFPDIPQVVIDATLAAEDERFYDHPGVDFRAGLRSIFVNAREGRSAQGASTITMQLAKAITGNDKNLDRKLKNVALAIEIEKTKTKDEILKLYLNNSYYGAGAYGVAAAADVYFGKKLEKLTIAEAALLARLVQRPSDYNPFNNPEVALEKRNLVLRKMRELNVITSQEFSEAIEEPLKLRKDHQKAGHRILGSPYFVNYVLDTIRRRRPDLDLSQGGFRIETTLNTEMQEFAEDAVSNVVRRYRRSGVTTGAFVCMDYQGEVKAMVGGIDYKRNQYNVIAQGRRQPGSAMKPFVFAAALSTGAVGMYESISNAPHYIETPNGRKLWPKGGGKGGSVSLRTTLAASINVPSVRVLEKVGPHTAANYARDVFGIDSPLDPVPSLVLGSSAVSPLELAEAYSVFMLYGDRATPYGIRRIICPDGTIIDDLRGKVIENVFDPSVSEFIDDCLRAVVRGGGTAPRAGSIPNARGKTGTTQEGRDAWFCGYTNNLVGIGWVSNEQFKNGKPYYLPMPSVFGGKVTVDIWVEFMRGALRKYDDSRTHSKGRTRPLPSVEADSERIEPDPTDDSPGIPGDDPNFPDEVPPLESPGEVKREPNRNPKPDEPVTQSPVKTTEPPNSNGDSETVSAEICVESGMRASPYCPETVTRRFARAGVPTRCRQHGPTRR